MGKLIIVSKEKSYKLDVYLNNHLICKLKGLETKCFEVNNGVYEINCKSSSSTKSESEVVDLNKDAKILIYQGFIKPKIYNESISEEEMKEYKKCEFVNLGFTDQTFSNEQKNLTNIENSHNTNNLSIGGIISAILIFIFAYFFLFSGTNNNLNNTSVSQPIQKNMGDSLDCRDYIATLDKVITKTGTIDSIQYIPDGHEWIGLIVTVKNNSNEEQQIFNDDFEIINSNGERIKHQTIVYNVFEDYEKLSSPTLVPGGSKTGFISFDNDNQDNSNLIIELKCNSISWFNDDPIYQIKYAE